ncbi:MAG: tetratricopeptide repeat protein [Gammaproteobacteria bacterium]|nr:tetratricopeptide repeat protein [Gammaproteobacteria bacterium]
MKQILQRLAVLTALTALAACVSAPSVSTPEPLPPASENGAVLALLDQAQTEITGGRLQSALGTLERTLRIEPRNPRLWQELARLKLSLGDAEQAEQMARRANQYAGADRRLLALSWRIIAEARTVRGDANGAQEAEDRVRQLGL